MTLKNERIGQNTSDYVMSECWHSEQTNVRVSGWKISRSRISKITKNRLKCANLTRFVRNRSMVALDHDDLLHRGKFPETPYNIKSDIPFLGSERLGNSFDYLIISLFAALLGDSLINRNDFAIDCGFLKRWLLRQDFGYSLPFSTLTDYSG